MKIQWLLFLSLTLLLYMMIGTADVCPNDPDPCGKIDATRPRACSACIGVTMNATNATYLYEGLKEVIGCTLHGLYTNNPTVSWTKIYPNTSSKAVSQNISTSTNTADGTKTSYLSIEVGDVDMSYTCKFTATDGFSVEDYIAHKVGDAKSTIRCEISTDGSTFNTFWGYNDSTAWISSSSNGYEVSINNTWLNMTMDASNTWTAKKTYRCATTFDSSGAHKSVTIKALRIVTTYLASVIFAGISTNITVGLKSVNPSAQFIQLSFGSHVLDGNVSGETYTSSEMVTFQKSDEKIWTITTLFQYPDDTSNETITKDYMIYIAELLTPTTYICIKGETCELNINFTLSTIKDITANSQTSEFRSNGTNKKDVAWVYKNGHVTASLNLSSAQYDDEYKSHAWSFYLQNGTNLTLDVKLDVAEISRKDITAFDNSSDKITYHCKLANSMFNATGCFAQYKNKAKISGTLVGNACTISNAPVEALAEYSFTCGFYINNQTVTQDILTDYVDIGMYPAETIINITGSDVDMTCSISKYIVQPNVTWSCTSEWCEYPGKTLGSNTTGVVYNSLYEAQTVCQNEPTCTGTVMENENGMKKYTARMNGTLATSSDSKDIAWVQGQCDSSRATAEISCLNKDLDYPDNNIGLKTSFTSLTECIDDCLTGSSSSSSCLAIVWQESTKKCWPKNKVPDLTNVTSVDSVSMDCINSYTATWTSIASDCYNNDCAVEFNLEEDPIQIKYAANPDKVKYLNFFDSTGTKTGHFAWGLENSAAMQLNDCGTIGWISKPANSVKERTWTVHKNTTHIWMFLDQTKVFEQNFTAGSKCADSYKKATVKIGFNKFKTDTVKPAYKKAEKPSTVRLTTNQSHTISSYTEKNITRDTNCTCSAKFNAISTINKKFIIKHADRTSPETYYSLSKTIVSPACSLGLKSSTVDGYVEWYFNNKLMGNNTYTKTRYQSTSYYNISSSFDVTALSAEHSSAELICLLNFNNSPTLNFTVGVGLVNFHTNELVFTANTKSLTYNCTVEGSGSAPWVYYRSFSGGDLKKLDGPVFTEDSWGLTDYTLKCLAKLPSQNISQLFYVDRSVPIVLPDISDDTYIQVWSGGLSNFTSKLTYLHFTPSIIVNTCKDSTGKLINEAGKGTNASYLSAPVASSWRSRKWDDEDCNFVFVFGSTNISVAFKTDVYDMHNMSEVGVTGQPITINMTITNLKVVKNVKVSWNISNSFSSITKGYNTTNTTNSTAVSSTLKIDTLHTNKHGKHLVSVITNGGVSYNNLMLYVIDAVQIPHSNVLQRRGYPVTIACRAYNWRDNGTASWNVSGTTSTEYKMTLTISYNILNLTTDTLVKSKFTFKNGVFINKTFDIDVFEMNNVSVEAIANVDSTTTKKFPITNLQNLAQLKAYWSVNGKSMTVTNGGSKVDRHLVKYLNKTGNTNATLELEINAVTSIDRGNIPITVAGVDGLSHTAYIKVYVIEFEDGQRKNLTHQSGDVITLTCSTMGWLTNVTSITWTANNGYSYTNISNTTYTNTTINSVITPVIDEDIDIICNYTYGEPGLWLIRTLYIDTFDSPNTTALAMVGSTVYNPLNITGIANESAVTIYWEWNQVMGTIDEFVNHTSIWHPISCACNHASCPCAIDMNIITYDVFVKHNSIITERSDQWRTVVFYDGSGAWIAYISWNDMKSQVKTKCEGKPHPVTLPPLVNKTRTWKIDINSTHLILECQGVIIVTDPALCPDAFVPSDFSLITKVGFDTNLKKDGAKYLIKKDDRVHISKLAYKDDTFLLALFMKEIRVDDSGAVRLSVNTKTGKNYTSYVNVIYADVQFGNISVISKSTTPPTVALNCTADIRVNYNFTMSIQCSKNSSNVSTSVQYTQKSSGFVNLTLDKLTSDSCVQYMCTLEVDSHKVYKTADVNVLYDLKSDAVLVEEGWSGNLSMYSKLIGNFSTFNKVCNTTSDKNSTVTITNSIVQCSIPISNVTVNQSRNYTVTGFEVAPSVYVNTTISIQVASINTSTHSSLNSMDNAAVTCTTLGIPAHALVKFLGANVQGTLKTTYNGSTRLDVFTQNRTITSNLYPKCIYELAGYTGHVSGTTKFYIIDAKIYSIAGIGLHTAGEITCTIEHDKLLVNNGTFTWYNKDVEYNQTNATYKVMISTKYNKTGYYNDTVYDSKSVLTLVKPENKTYNVRCEMVFDTGTHSLNIMLNSLEISPTHKTYDSSKPMLVIYTVKQHCDTTHIVKDNYNVMGNHTNITQHHQQFAIVKSTAEKEYTNIITKFKNPSNSMSGHYYDVCGVRYYGTNHSEHGNHSDGNASSIEYVFLPFEINVIDLTSIGEVAQSKGQSTHLFFLVEHALVKEPVENVTLTAKSDSVTASVSAIELVKGVPLDGPASSNVTFIRGMTSLMIDIDFPSNQDNGTTIDCNFNIGNDSFSMTAMLGDYYDTIITDVTYSDHQAVNISIVFVEIPSTSPVFTLSNPYSARNIKFNKTTVVTNTTETTSLGLPLYNYTVYITHDSASTDMAGWYDVYLQVPHVNRMKTFLIQTKFAFNNIEISNVKVAVEQDKSTSFELVLTDYTDYELIRITSLTWDKNTTFNVSGVVKSGYRSYEATAQLTSAASSDAGTYKFTFGLETGESFTGTLEISIITPVNGTTGICLETVYNNTIYGILNWPATENGATATIDCVYRSVAVTADTAFRSCSNETWGTVNQTLCGSVESSTLRTLVSQTSTNSSQMDLTNYNMQIKFVTELKEYVQANVSLLAGSDLTALDTVLNQVTYSLDNGIVYYETVDMFVDIMDSLVQNVSDEAVSIYSVSSLNLRETASNFALTVYLNDTSKTVVFNRTSIAIIVGPLAENNATTISTSLGSNQLTVIMPKSSLLFSNSFNSSSRGVIAVVHAKPDHIYQTLTSVNKSVISPAIDLTLSEKGRKVKSLTTPITMKFSVNERITDNNSIQAVYYDTDTSSWSTDGCTTNITSNYTVIAYCNHLTGFSIQKSSVTYVAIKAPVQILFHGFGVSILFLVIILVIFLPIKSLRENPLIQTHGLLAATMLFANIFLVISVNTDENIGKGGCSLLVFIPHVLWLAVQAWLLIEGVLLHLLSTNGFQHRIKHRLAMFLVAAFSIPLFIAMVAAVVLGMQDDYFNKSLEICWLSANGLFYFFWIPTILFLLITLAFYGKVLLDLGKEDQKNSEEEIRTMKKTILFLTLLILLFTIGWMLAAVAGVETLNETFDNVQVVCNIMFIVFNVFQALALLILLFVLDPFVKESWMLFLGKSEKEESLELEMGEPVEEEPVPEPVSDDVKSVKKSEKSYRSVAASRKSVPSARSSRPLTVGQAIAPVSNEIPILGSDMEEEATKKTKGKKDKTEKVKKAKKDKVKDAGGEEQVEEGEKDPGEKPKKKKKKAKETPSPAVEEDVPPPAEEEGGGEETGGEGGGSGEAIEEKPEKPVAKSKKSKGKRK